MANLIEGQKVWVISDVHGHYEKLMELLMEIGLFEVDNRCKLARKEDIHVVFLGDYIDKGPQPLEVIELVDALVDLGYATAIMGNHDFWLQRYLNGADVMITPERQATLDAMTAIDPEWQTIGLVKAFLDELPFFTTYGDYRFAHAIFSESASKKDKKHHRFMLYGPIDKEAPPREDKLPNRVPWYETYRGDKGHIVFGHYSLSNEILEFPHATCVDCGVFKENGKLGAYELHTKRKVYV